MALDYVAVIKFHHLIFIFLWLQAALLIVTSSSFKISKPGCVNKCGDVSIPYPFGMGDKNCFLDQNFNITCDETFQPPTPFLANYEVPFLAKFELLDIDLRGQLRVKILVASECYKKDGNLTSAVSIFSKLRSFTFSDTRNKFVAIGCDTMAYILVNYHMSGCFSSCHTIDHMINGSCIGNGCCQASVPSGLTSYEIELKPVSNSRSSVWDISPCSYAFLVEESWYNFSTIDLKDNQNRSKVPVVIDWAVGNETCKEAEKNLTGTYPCGANSVCHDPSNGNGYLCNCLNGYEGNPYLIDGCRVIIDWAVGNETCKEAKQNWTGTYLCGVNSDCYDPSNGNGYRCNCSDGYERNPYLINGCQDIDECKNETLHECLSGACYNEAGSYRCSCPPGYQGDGKKKGRGSGCAIIESQGGNPVWIKITLGISLSILLLLVISSWLYWGFKKRKLIQMKEKFYRQNGGLMFEKIMKEQHPGKDLNMKIFTDEELKKATNNYDESRIIGKGGFGTVYKGILTGKTVVAIKKSKIVDQSQTEQFVNEVAVLSQVNHRNVVKLLGCCLENEVPLLVYEFVTNGTLFQHLHDEGRVSLLSWETRLRIAAEIATSLSYLHSEASIPIIHRDVKSCNILLDDNYTAKVADFGASRLVPLDQTQLSTLVQGTLGYLDPEYLQSSQLTDKSDVYSFGVLLAELLTGKKVLSFERPKEAINLATYFISAMKEDRVLQILEDHLVIQASVEHLEQVAELTKRCLRVEGEKRPTMKEVAAILDGLRKSVKHPSLFENEPNGEENVYLLSEATNSYTGTDVAGYDSLIELIPTSNGR